MSCTSSRGRRGSCRPSPIMIIIMYTNNNNHNNNDNTKNINNNNNNNNVSYYIIAYDSIIGSRRPSPWGRWSQSPGGYFASCRYY